MADLRHLADAGIGLAERHRVPLGKAHRPLTRPLQQLGIDGKAIAFGCTVVSIMTQVKRAGLAATERVARRRLSCSRAASFSVPMRWRQRMIEERSNGGCCVAYAPGDRWLSAGSGGTGRVETYSVRPTTRPMPFRRLER
jgi:hypothetical protein